MTSSIDAILQHKLFYERLCNTNVTDRKLFFSLAHDITDILYNNDYRLFDFIMEPSHVDHYDPQIMLTLLRYSVKVQNQIPNWEPFRDNAKKYFKDNGIYSDTTFYGL